MIPVVILCGGLGTRLRSVVQELPKVMAPVRGKPFLWYLLEKLRAQSFGRVILSAGYKAGYIRRFVQEYDFPGLELEVVVEPEPLGTGGAVGFAFYESQVEPPVAVMNGDTYFSGSVRRLVDRHSDLNAKATIALARVHDSTAFGTVELDRSTGAVTSFKEKTSERTGPAWINAGVYVLGQDFLRGLPANQLCSIERDIFPQWVGSGLFGVQFPDAAFLDIGSPVGYSKAEKLLLSHG